MKSETDPRAWGFLAAATFWISAIALVTCGSCVHMVASVGSPRPLATERSRAAVKIVSTCTLPTEFDETITIGAGGRVGSGVILDDRHVLTADHLVRCPVIPELQVETSDGKIRRMVVEREWRGHDVARLEMASLDKFDVGAARIAAPPELGAVVCDATGYPTRGFNCGDVEKYNDTPDGDIQFGGLVRYGNSGSGLYDEGGRLVGIVTGGMFMAYTREPTGTGFASRMRPEFLR